MSFSTPLKILDATSGNSQEFYDNLFNSSLPNIKSNLTYRLTIVGTPLANVKAFITAGHSYVSQSEQKILALTIKVSCSNWNGASVKIQGKTSHVDDTFTDTGDIFTKDEAIDKIIYLNSRDGF